MDTLTNSEDPDEMQHKAAFHQGLDYLLRFKEPLGTQIHNTYDDSTCEPSTHTMDSAKLIVPICVEIQSEYKGLKESSNLDAFLI